MLPDLAPVPPDLQLLGLLLAALLVFLSATLLFLRVKDSLAEKPDPKLTYATLAELDKLRQSLLQAQRDARADLATETERVRRTTSSTHELIRKNAEHIAALIAQTQMNTQRLAELNTRTERLSDKLATLHHLPTS